MQSRNRSNATDKQIEANRRNAQKGGVKSDAGKLVSRMNSYKHGGLSNSVLNDELPAYKSLHEELTEELKPTGVVERILVERIALCVLQMRRVSFAANEFIRQIEDPEVSTSVLDLVDHKEVLHEGYKPAITIDEIEKLLELYQRYQVGLENRFLKLTREFAA